jgi:hypothetical protein
VSSGCRLQRVIECIRHSFTLKRCGRQEIM